MRPECFGGNLVVEMSGASGWRTICDSTVIAEVDNLYECKRSHRKTEARKYEDQKSDLGADLLSNVAELCFAHAKRLKNANEQEDIMQMLIDDLVRAREEDGIGMYTGDEWLYDEVREKIEEWQDK